MRSKLRRLSVLGTVLAALAAAVLTGIGVFTASASSPTAPSVSLSSNTAGEGGVTYTVGFSTSSTGAIPAGGSITLVAPAGTVWPHSDSAYALTDSTTSSGSFTSTTAMTFADPGLNLYNWLDGNRGAAVTFTVPNAINAGDSLSLAISGVVNPDSGTKTLSLATSADADATTSAPYVIIPAATVTSPSVSLTSNTAGVSGVTYTVGFSTSSTGAIPAGGSITLVAPAGTVWPHSDSAYALTDSTTSSGSFTSTTGMNFADPGLNLYNWLDGDRGAAVTFTVPNAINAGDSLSLAISGVVNPDSGTKTLSVATSTDADAATSASYVITPPSSVTSPWVSLTSNTAGVSGVTYTVGFSTSSTGAVPAGGSITLVAPAGTVWPGSGSDYSLTDSTTAGGSFASASGAQVSDNDAAVTITVPNAIKGSDVLSLAVSGVTNAGAGSQVLTVFTSNDPKSATSASYALSGTASSATAVSSPTFAATSTAAVASGVTYTVGFTTSASGALVGGSSSVTLVVPQGTIFGTCPYGDCGPSSTYTFTDLTHSSGSGSTTGGLSGNGSIVTVPVTNTIEAGDQVTLAITAVTNPPTGTGSMELSTSSDTAAVTLADPTTTANPVTSPTFTPSTTASEATGVTYTIGFTASATGALVGGSSSVTVAAPGATIFGGCPYNDCGPSSTYTFTDLTHSSGSGSAGPGVAVLGGIVSVTVPGTIQAGDQVILTITAVSNPPTGSGSIEFSTSSDTTPVTLAGSTATTAKAVTSPNSLASNGAGGATGVTYAVGLTTSTTGELLAGEGTIDIDATPATNLGAASQVTVTDLSHPTGSGTVSSDSIIGGGSVASYVVPNTIQPGDVISLSIVGVTNPAAGAPTLGISTSSDSVPATPSVLAPLSGTVTYEGNPVVSSPVQACPTTGGTCTTTTTNSSGAFLVGVAPTAGGTYSVTADPPTFGVDASPGTVSPLIIPGPDGLSGVSIVLQAPLTLSSGVTIVSPNFGVENSSTATPTTYWDSPYQLELPPSLFPTGGAVVVTGVEIHGTNSITGLPMVTTVDVGGSIGGNPTGEVLGTQPLDVTIPSLYPMHGAISTTANYEFFPGLNIPAGTTTPPSGVAATQVLFETYPQQIGVAPTDPLPAYFTNYDDPPGVTMGPGSITGQDAQYFSIVPLTSYGVPAGTTDCSTVPAVLEQDDQTDQSTPPPSTSCGMAVQFTPPPQPGADKIFYYATLEAQIKAGAVTTDIPVLLIGCDSRVSQEASQVTMFDVCNNEGWDGGPVLLPPPPPPPLDDDDSTAGSAEAGGSYVDPSGTVNVSTPGGPAPLAGATVTLSQGSTPSGPFTAVPNGSDVMSPANRTNPGTTDSQGHFGWDVLPGNYEVGAQAPGCTPATTPSLSVPPPALGLSLTLTCSSPPSRASTTTALSSSSSDSPFGSLVTLSAAVTGSGGTPTGTVTFLDGATTLGNAVVTGGTASVSLSDLAPGTHPITADYSGDSSYQPSTATPFAQTIVGPSGGPAVTTDPTSQSVYSGASVTFSAAASGTPTPTVEWQVSVNGGASWINVPSLDTPSFSGMPNAFVNGWEFRAVFSNSGGTATTTEATLTVLPDIAPLITTQPINQSVAPGGTATFTAAASGTPAPAVEWQVSVNRGTSWINVPSLDTPSFSGMPTAFVNGWEFRAVFSNGGGSATSDPATLTIT